MRRTLLGLFCSVLATSCLGCWTTVTYTINPDGTARVDLVRVMPNANYRQAEEVEATLRKHSKTFRGWQQVSYERGANGGATCKGRVVLGSLEAAQLSLLGHVQPVLKDNDDGTKTLLIHYDDQFDQRPRKALTEAEIRRRIAKVKRDYLRVVHAPETAAARKDRFTVIVDPPGKVKSVVNMKQRKDGKLEVTYEYGKVLDALGDILNDERAVREFVSAGETLFRVGRVLPTMINERLFGIRAPVEAILEGPFDRKFDYKKEAAACELDPCKLVAESGIIPASLPQPGAAGNLKGIKVVRAEYVKGKDPYVRLGFKGTLPQVGSYQNGGELYRVTDERGNVLLPKLERTRGLQVALADDGKSAEVSAYIRMGDAPHKALGRVSGVLRYRALGLLHPEDLGTLVPAHGARLNKHQFVLTDYDTRGGKIVFNWSAALPPYLARVVFLEGKKEFLAQDVEAEPYARDYDRPFTFFDRSLRPPRSLQVLFYTASKIEIVEVPFVLQDVPLTQR